MTLELVTLTGPKVQEDVYEVVVPTAAGEIAIFPGHMPLVSLAIPGVITIRRHKNDSDDKLEHFATNGGVVDISPARVRVLVDVADHADDIHEDAARQALTAAQALKAKAKDQVELNHAQALIDRQAVRLKVAELRRRHRPRA